MNKAICFLLGYLLCFQVSFGQLPDPALVGYWHNWNDANAPYVQLDQIDPRYNVINLSFAVPHFGTDYQMEFIPDQVSQATLTGQIQSLQSQGRKVVISMGGATAPVSLDNISERDTFISTMNAVINTYGFDGIDIDFEGNSVSVSGGTIAAPVDAKVINLIDAIKQIMGDYYSTHQKHLILSMAPETAFVQGGMSAFGGIWGAYLPIIHALRDSLDLLHVQLYNSGSMFGIDGNIYTQGTADFIVAMTEAVIHGFNTSGGMFDGLPESKVAIGLPACQNAAGGGFTDTSTVRMAIDYLRGNGPQPGSYILTQTGGYPALRGMMTWSVNWDATSSCASVYQYAENFERIFGGTSTGTLQQFSMPASIMLYPNPAADFITISILSKNRQAIEIINSMGNIVYSGGITIENKSINISGLQKGIYLVRVGNRVSKFTKQ